MGEEWRLCVEAGLAMTPEQADIKTLVLLMKPGMRLFRLHDTTAQFPWGYSDGKGWGGYAVTADRALLNLIQHGLEEKG